jgi:hypothetical protein
VQTFHENQKYKRASSKLTFEFAQDPESTKDGNLARADLSKKKFEGRR